MTACHLISLPTAFHQDALEVLKLYLIRCYHKARWRRKWSGRVKLLVVFASLVLVVGANTCKKFDRFVRNFSGIVNVSVGFVA